MSWESVARVNCQACQQQNKLAFVLCWYYSKSTWMWAFLHLSSNLFHDNSRSVFGWVVNWDYFDVDFSAPPATLFNFVEILRTNWPHLENVKWNSIKLTLSRLEDIKLMKLSIKWVELDAKNWMKTPTQWKYHKALWCVLMNIGYMRIQESWTFIREQPSTTYTQPIQIIQTFNKKKFNRGVQQIFASQSQHQVWASRSSFTTRKMSFNECDDLDVCKMHDMLSFTRDLMM